LNDNVVESIQPGIFAGHSTRIWRNGARALSSRAVEAEVAEFFTKHTDLETGDGHRRAARQPRVRDPSHSGAK
jgi:hypothetical protein